MAKEDAFLVVVRSMIGRRMSGSGRVSEFRLSGRNNCEPVHRLPLHLLTLLSWVRISTASMKNEDKNCAGGSGVRSNQTPPDVVCQYSTCTPSILVLRTATRMTVFIPSVEHGKLQSSALKSTGSIGDQP